MSEEVKDDFQKANVEVAEEAAGSAEGTEKAKEVKRNKSGS